MIGKRLIAGCACLLLATAFQIQAQDVTPALDTSRAAAQDMAQSQERIDQMDEGTQSLLGDYRANLKQLEQIQRYNVSLERQVAAQRRELESLRQDINNISALQRAVQPLMEDMVDALENVFEADIPFLEGERRERVERLKAIVNDPERSPAQRYRLAVEAYQIEADMGRTVDAYRADLEVDGTLYENASFLRVGRIALIMVTDDDSVLKRYDLTSRQWVDLNRSYLSHVRSALRMAREQIPVDLMYLPITAPQQANGG